MIGWSFGEGLYFNYLLLLVGIVDVLFGWLRPEQYETRPAWLEYGFHGYLFLIAINGAVNFQSSVTRICETVAIVIFVVNLFPINAAGWSDSLGVPSLKDDGKNVSVSPLLDSGSR